MYQSIDFRLVTFNFNNIVNAGKFIGKNVYWKLYTIENIFRIIIHSVLVIETPKDSGKDWWDLYVNSDIKDIIEKFKKPYLKKVWHGKQGNHDIYYVDLKRLNIIINENKPLFEPIIPDIDKWVLDIENIILPRNIVAHMNFPTKTDAMRIDVLYDDCKALILSIESKIKLSFPK